MIVPAAIDSMPSRLLTPGDIEYMAVRTTIDATIDDVVSAWGRRAQGAGPCAYSMYTVHTPHMYIEEATSVAQLANLNLANLNSCLPQSTRHPAGC